MLPPSLNPQKNGTCCRKQNLTEEIKTPAKFNLQEKGNYFYIQSSAVITRSNITLYIAHTIAGTEAEYQSKSVSTKGQKAPHTSRAFGVFCEYFGENWTLYNGTALYIASTLLYNAESMVV